MKTQVSIFFFNFTHYHVARCAALRDLLQSLGGKAYIYALRDRAPDRPVPGDQHLLGTSIKVFNSVKVPINSWSNVRKLISALNHDQPEAVVIPGYRSWPCYAALAWCKVRSRLAILLSESQRRDYPRTWWQENAKRHIVKRFDAALVGGAPQFDYALELGLTHNVIFSGYDVVDNLFWEKQAEGVRHNADEERRRLCLPRKFFIAAKQFIPKKNIHRLIKAYALYRSWIGEKAWDLVICGSGPLEEDIRRSIQQLDLQANVLLPGYKNANEMAVIYGLASAFVHASSHAEQWGLVVNEAMASGLPVLVSEICGCAQDLVRDGVNGFKFDPYDVEGLARLMLIMSTGEVNLKAMGAASQEIISHWTPETFARNLLTAIEAGRIANRPQ